MITSECTNPHDFISQFTAFLKQARFSGQFLLKNSLGQSWVFYLFLGRILYATGGTHPARRWRRNLIAHCPKVDIHKLKLSVIPSNSSAEALDNCWEYQLLCSGLEQGLISRETTAKIIGSIVAEVLFDVTQAGQVTYQVKPEKSSKLQLVLLNPEQVIAEVQQVWQTWQKAQIANRSPNQAPTIKQSEQLQQQTSASVYQVLTRLLDGQYTLRDLAVQMKRDVVDVVCSLLPYIEAGSVELIDIPDLSAPIAPTSSAVAPPAATRTEPVIACVDYSPAVCRCMEKIFTSAGYQFLAVQDSLQAIATLSTHKPDLIFLDLVMPNTNGYEICSQLRKASAFRDTPIIILTSNDGVIERVRAKIVGSSGFLSKPVHAKTVLAVARAHLNDSSLVE